LVKIKSVVLYNCQTV